MILTYRKTSKNEDKFLKNVRNENIKNLSSLISLNLKQFKRIKLSENFKNI